MACVVHGRHIGIYVFIAGITGRHGTLSAPCVTVTKGAGLILTGTAVPRVFLVPITFWIAFNLSSRVNFNAKILMQQT